MKEKSYILGETNEAIVEWIRIKTGCRKKGEVILHALYFYNRICEHILSGDKIYIGKNALDSREMIFGPLERIDNHGS